MLDEMGHRREYNVPFIPVNMLIPFNPMYGEEGRLDTKVFVVCDFVNDKRYQSLLFAALEGTGVRAQR